MLYPNHKLSEIRKTTEEKSFFICPNHKLSEIRKTTEEKSFFIGYDILDFKLRVFSNLAPGNMDVKTTTTCKVGKVFN
ncbi:MAG: hypothetical protein C4323_11485, partial [Mastigocladus sp. ERB_26_2]